MIELEREITAIKEQRAFLIGFLEADQDRAVVESQLDELADLVRNLEIVPLEPEIIKIRTPQVRYRVGSGKAEEVARLVQECEADLLVFDTELTPSQQRNWEKLTGCPVVGREEIILEIFASRAMTKEAVLQVELAKLEYSLPRLHKAWTHLSRQRGGGATNRGQGEAQLETDRRLIKRRIQQLKDELAIVRKQRAAQRKSRIRRPVVQGALVGYTNVGKSSLLNALCDSDVLVKDQLFATLDPTARKIILPGNVEMVLNDTVGFVRKLPHQLVEAFKSTLEEAVLADILLLVLDVSSDDIDNEWETTIGVLKELGADEKRMVVVFNKMDRIDPESQGLKLARLRGLFPQAVYVSAHSGAGLDVLRQHLADFAARSRCLLRAEIPPSRYDLITLAHSAGNIYEENYAPDGTAELIFAIEEKFQHRFKEFLR
ncbi:MAG: GTPase HflX [Lentisphaerae bacterium]|nr:GTPase HflX [Lentisphaerota bacterium]